MYKSMKGIAKRLFAWIIVLTMVVTMLPATTVSAADDVVKEEQGGDASTDEGEVEGPESDEGEDAGPLVVESAELVGLEEDTVLHSGDTISLQVNLYSTVGAQICFEESYLDISIISGRSQDWPATTYVSHEWVDGNTYIITYSVNYKVVANNACEIRGMTISDDAGNMAYYDMGDENNDYPIIRMEVFYWENVSVKNITLSSDRIELDETVSAETITFTFELEGEIDTTELLVEYRSEASSFIATAYKNDAGVYVFSIEFDYQRVQGTENYVLTEISCGDYFIACDVESTFVVTESLPDIDVPVIEDVWFEVNGEAVDTGFTISEEDMVKVVINAADESELKEVRILIQTDFMGAESYGHTINLVWDEEANAFVAELDLSMIDATEWCLWEIYVCDQYGNEEFSQATDTNRTWGLQSFTLTKEGTSSSADISYDVLLEYSGTDWMEWVSATTGRITTLNEIFPDGVPEVTKDNCEFLGWCLNGILLEPDTLFLVDQYNMNLHPVFDKVHVSYTVHYSDESGMQCQSGDSVEVPYGTKYEDVIASIDLSGYSHYTEVELVDWNYHCGHLNTDYICHESVSMLIKAEYDRTFFTINAHYYADEECSTTTNIIVFYDEEDVIATEVLRNYEWPELDHFEGLKFVEWDISGIQKEVVSQGSSYNVQAIYEELPINVSYEYYNAEGTYVTEEKYVYVPYDATYQDVVDAAGLDQIVHSDIYGFIEWEYTNFWHDLSDTIEYEASMYFRGIYAGCSDYEAPMIESVELIEPEGTLHTGDIFEMLVTTYDMGGAGLNFEASCVDMGVYSGYVDDFPKCSFVGYEEVGENQYLLTYRITNRISSTNEYTIQQISIADKVGNTTTYELYNDFGEYPRIEVEKSYRDDVTVSDITLSQEEIILTDEIASVKLTFTITLEGNYDADGKVWIGYEHEEGGFGSDTYYLGDGVYETSITFTYENVHGIDHYSLKDIAYNGVYLRTEITSTFVTEEDISDTEAPIVHDVWIEINDSKADSGATVTESDTVKIVADIEDASWLEVIQVALCSTINNIDATQYTFELEYNEETGYYERVLDVEELAATEWYVREMRVRDRYWNEVMVSTDNRPQTLNLTYFCMEKAGECTKSELTYDVIVEYPTGAEVISVMTGKITSLNEIFSEGIPTVSVEDREFLGWSWDGKLIEADELFIVPEEETIMLQPTYDTIRINVSVEYIDEDAEYHYDTKEMMVPYGTRFEDVLSEEELSLYTHYTDLGFIQWNVEARYECAYVDGDGVVFRAEYEKLYASLWLEYFENEENSSFKQVIITYKEEGTLLTDVLEEYDWPEINHLEGLSFVGWDVDQWEGEEIACGSSYIVYAEYETIPVNVWYQYYDAEGVYQDISEYVYVPYKCSYQTLIDAIGLEEIEHYEVMGFIEWTTPHFQGDLNDSIGYDDSLYLQATYAQNPPVNVMIEFCYYDREDGVEWITIGVNVIEGTTLSEAIAGAELSDIVHYENLEFLEWDMQGHENDEILGGEWFYVNAVYEAMPIGTWFEYYDVDGNLQQAFAYVYAPYQCTYREFLELAAGVEIEHSEVCGFVKWEYTDLDDAMLDLAIGYDEDVSVTGAYANLVIDVFWEYYDEELNYNIYETKIGVKQGTTYRELVENLEQEFVHSKDLIFVDWDVECDRDMDAPIELGSYVSLEANYKNKLLWLDYEFYEPGLESVYIGTQVIYDPSTSYMELVADIGRELEHASELHFVEWIVMNPEELEASQTEVWLTVFADYEEDVIEMNAAFLNEDNEVENPYYNCVLEEGMTYQDLLDKYCKDIVHSSDCALQGWEIEAYPQSDAELSDVIDIAGELNAFVYFEACYDEYPFDLQYTYYTTDGMVNSLEISGFYPAGTLLWDILMDVEVEDACDREITAWYTSHANCQNETVGLWTTRWEVQAAYDGFVPVNVEFYSIGVDNEPLYMDTYIYVETEDRYADDMALLIDNGIFEVTESLNSRDIFIECYDVRYVYGGDTCGENLYSILWSCVWVCFEQHLAVLVYPDDTQETLLVDRYEGYTLPEEYNGRAVAWEVDESGTYHWPEGGEQFVSRAPYSYAYAYYLEDEYVFEITGQPESQMVKENEYTAFIVEAVGDGLTYQWQFSRDGINWYNSGMDGAKTECMNVQALISRDGYQYRCVITDANGTTIVSEEATLTINTYVFEITSQPESQTIAKDAYTTFEVEAVGEGLTYQWQFCRDGVYWSNSSMAGSNTASMQVQALASRDGYQYRCVITDANGTTIISEAATLTVNTYVFEITSQPESQTIAKDAYTIFEIEAVGEGLTYQWQCCKDGSYWFNSGMTGSNTASMQVQALANRDGYQYRCVITDANGTTIVSEAATLTVNVYVFEITSQPESQSVNENEYTVFSVEAVGEGLSYQWQFCKDGSYWSNSGMAGSQTPSMSVQALPSRDGYQYRCVITDAEGNQLISASAMLTVNTFVITKQPESQTLNENEYTTFTVEVQGSGLSYQWQFKRAGEAWTNSGMAGSNTASMTVQALASRDGYQYRCVITDANDNQLISEAATLTVNVFEITKQPESQNVSLNEYTVFTVEAEGNGLSYQWQFSKDGSYWSNSSMAGSNTASMTVQALASRNGYQYRCVITDAKGNQLVSEAATLTVLSFVITKQPESQIVNENGYTAYTVEVSGSGISYQWQFSKDGSYWSNSSMAGSNTASMTVQALASRDGYQYRCVITDENGNQLISDVATLTISRFAITKQPESQTVALDGYTTFTVEAEGNGLIYQWQFSKDGSYWSNSSMAGSDTASMTVQALASRNGYQYRCVITDANDNQLTTETVTLTIK